MNCRILTLILILTGTVCAENTGSGQVLRRMALVMGANNGGAERVRLKYAYTDADAFARVLVELGGVDSRDIIVLKEPSPDKVLSSLKKLESSLLSEKGRFRRQEVVIYYSGHADESGLLLGENKLIYQDLKDGIKILSADVRIAVLDACGAGALTRLKGGKKRQAFLVDESADMQGHAFLTSNTADEAAQESDRIQGSYFTQSLVSGMRGAADLTQDGMVTLNEAYQYAFHETLAKTEGTQAGAQHAGYDMRLSGTGEVVMTDLRETSATLTLEENMDGRLFVRDDKGILVVELRKYKGRMVELGLEPGLYQVTLQKQGPLLQSQVEVATGGENLLSEADMASVDREAAVSRGGNIPEDSLSFGDAVAAAARAVGVAANKAVGEVGKLVERDGKKEGKAADSAPAPAAAVADTAPYDTIPVSFAVIPYLKKENGKLIFPRTFHYQSYNLLAGAYYQLHGIGIGLVGQWAIEDVRGGQISYAINYTGRQLTGFQGASVVNIANTVHGGQGTGFFNMAYELKGGQGAGFANFAVEVKGGQGAGFANFAADVDGGQGAGFANFAHDVKGGQGASFGNFARDVKGGQGAAFGNFARNVTGGQGAAFGNFAHDVKGGQGAAFGNFAHSVKGGQGAAFGNFAGKVEGVQGSAFGNFAGSVEGVQATVFLNAAGYVKGVQAGFINLAGTVDGETFGILNLNRNAKIHPGVWVDEAGVGNLSLKTGSGHVYGILNAGLLLRTDHSKDRIASHGLGMGAEFPFNRMLLSVDVTGNRFKQADRLFTSLGNHFGRVRIAAAFAAFSHLRPTAGISLNLMYQRQKSLEYQDYLPAPALGNSRAVYWTGFFAGVDF